MSKISRVVSKLFGSTGTTSFFGQPGSLPAGTKVNTKDPATIQGLSAFLAGLESIIQAGTYKVALEDLNSLFLLAFYQISYLMQAGVAEWDASTTYYIGSIANVSGTLYKSITDGNLNNNPASSPTNWIVAAGVPIGMTEDFAGPVANIPAGYLVCDGAAISRTTYANLFAAIGTAWGVGDGSTTFNLPDLKGVVTAGYDAAQSEFNAVGKKGGAKTVTSSNHQHGLPIGIDNNYGLSYFQPTPPYGTGETIGVNRNLGQGEYITGATTMLSKTGGSEALSVLQPYGTMLKIIKY